MGRFRGEVVCQGPLKNSTFPPDVVVSSYMLTVPEAAKRAGRDPETIRRWIRLGRLRARKVGTQHVIEDEDLEAILADSGEMLPVPQRWRRSDSGRPLPNVVAAIRRSRRGH
jgi:excisionase family DNA binding protein